jgi:hypothetical protein
MHENVTTVMACSGPATSSSFVFHHGAATGYGLHQRAAAAISIAQYEAKTAWEILGKHKERPGFGYTQQF